MGRAIELVVLRGDARVWPAQGRDAVLAEKFNAFGGLRDAEAEFLNRCCKASPEERRRKRMGLSRSGDEGLRR